MNSGSKRLQLNARRPPWPLSLPLKIGGKKLFKGAKLCPVTLFAWVGYCGWTWFWETKNCDREIISCKLKNLPAVSTIWLRLSRCQWLLVVVGCCLHSGNTSELVCLKAELSSSAQPWLKRDLWDSEKDTFFVLGHIKRNKNISST